MERRMTSRVSEVPGLRDRLHVFRDRAHAGEILAGMLEDYRSSQTLIMAIPAGGIPVAAVLARKLLLPLDVAVVSKITLPWNTEAGYGAVAFDGTTRLNRDLLPRLRLSEEEIEAGKAATVKKVERRVDRFRGSRPYPDLIKEKVILVDDGLASGFTLLVGVEALKKSGAGDHRCCSDGKLKRRSACGSGSGQPALRQHPGRLELCRCRCLRTLDRCGRGRSPSDL